MGQFSKTIVLMTVVIGVVLLGVVFYFLTRPYLVKPAPVSESILIKPMVASEFQIITNPLEGQIPDINPLEKTNPFSQSYQNPFAD